MEVSQVLFQPGIIESICSNLNLQQIQDLMRAYQIKSVPCQVTFYDKIDKTQLTLPGINDHTLRIYYAVKNDGYRKILYETITQGKTEDEQLETVRTLLKMGIDVNDRGHLSWPALIIASIFNRVSIIKILLENGANPNITSNNKSTALITAAGRGYNQIVEILLDYGANINARNNVGETALSRAIKNNQYRTVELLKLRGAK